MGGSENTGIGSASCVPASLPLSACLSLVCLLFLSLFLLSPSRVLVILQFPPSSPVLYLSVAPGASLSLSSPSLNIAISFVLCVYMFCLSASLPINSIPSSLIFTIFLLSLPSPPLYPMPHFELSITLRSSMPYKARVRTSPSSRFTCKQKIANRPQPGAKNERYQPDTKPIPNRYDTRQKHYTKKISL